MPQPILWEPETTFHTIVDIHPQLASWDKLSHPSQVRLRGYLDTLMVALLPLPAADQPLFLHLDIDVRQPIFLLKHHDLENYLTPLFGAQRLDASRFVLVTARKFVGGGSKLLLGTARPVSDHLLGDSWQHFSHVAQVSLQSKPGKENLRTALAATNPIPLAAPAVEVQIAWSCSPRRNWVNLWKPTGDCMGPILGEENPLRPFAPHDDRITALKFHRTLDVSVGNAVHIDMWWRAAEPGSNTGNTRTLSVQDFPK